MQDWTDYSEEELHIALLGIDTADASCFLDTHQWSLLSPESHAMWGGHPSAQFRRISREPSLPPVACWRIDSLAFRDVLRSSRSIRRLLVDSGIGSHMLGDVIYGSADSAVYSAPGIFLPAIAGQEWVLVTDGDSAVPHVNLQRMSCSSLRADAIFAAMFRVGRAESQTAFEYGFTFINFVVQSKRNQLVKAGDQLVYRTKGRVEIVSIEENSRTGRYWVEYRSFPS